MDRALVCGAGGFIGGHLVRRLKTHDYWVRGVDIKRPEFSATAADDFVVGDLRDARVVADVMQDYDEVYQLAADMGGMGYIFGANDAAIMHNSALINLNVVEAARRSGVRRILYTSSACVYPQRNQADAESPVCSEDSVYPADPDSEYGWEKLWGERLYTAYRRNHDLDVKIARLHNIYGPEGTWRGGREKAPAALCRKAAEAPEGGDIEVWGDGRQTRSFLYVDECVEGLRRLMESDVDEPLNIGSEVMVTVNDLARRVITLSGKRLGIRNVDGATGVRGRNSNNLLISERLGWAPSGDLQAGLARTYAWISDQVGRARAANRRADG